MRATLIHNSSAGQQSPPRQEIMAALQEAGFTVSYRPTKNESDLDDALAEPGDLVVVAGGDGTVGAVAKRLAGRQVPLSPLPLGTANNIGTTLGLKATVLELVRGLDKPVRRAFRIGAAQGPWGESPFLEAVGAGLFAEMMAGYASEEDKTPERALGLLLDALKDMQPQTHHITLDGTDLSGPYLLVEAMNIRSLGPRLMLAPEADPGDDLLELVLLGESDRAALRAYLQARLEKQEVSPPKLTVRRGGQVRLRWQGAPLHVDDKIMLRGDEDAMTGADGPSLIEEVTITLGLALELWLPRWLEYP